MKATDLKMIGDEMIRVLTPVYESIDEIKQDIKGIKVDVKQINKTLDEHTNKIDALTVEMHDLKEDFGVNKDKVNSEINEVKEFVGMPASNN